MTIKQEEKALNAIQKALRKVYANNDKVWDIYGDSYIDNKIDEIVITFKFRVRITK